MVPRARVADLSNSPRKTEQEGRSEYLKGLALLAWISWEIIGLTGLGVFAGWAFHRWLGGPILLTVLLGVLGLAAAFYRIYLATKRLEKTE